MPTFKMTVIMPCKYPKRKASCAGNGLTSTHSFSHQSFCLYGCVVFWHRFYAPYSANTGFYYLRNNERTMALINSLLMQGDLIIQTKSHQIPLTFILQEMASLHGLSIYVWNAKTTEEFPGGHAFHRRKDFMRDLIAGNVKPYIFHMSWTKSKVNKVKFWQQLGEWYVSETCSAVDSSNALQALPADEGCCIATPVVTCHYKDKPSKIPCPDSPTIDQKGRTFWN